MGGTGTGGSGGGAVCKTSDYLWAAENGGPKTDERANGVSVDKAGNVYVTGRFVGSAVFGNTMLNSPDATHGDIYVAKADPMGNWLWAKAFGGADEDWGADIATDDNSEVYVAARFLSSPAGAMVDFGGNKMVSSPNGSAVILKLDDQGNILWAEQTTGPTEEQIESIHVDAPGNVWVAGKYAGGISLSVAGLPGDGPGYEGFVIKLDNLGNSLFGQAGLGLKTDGGTFDGVGSNGPSTVVVGRVTGQMDIDGKVFMGDGPIVASLDNQGHLQWADHVADPVGGKVDFNDVTLDGNGNAYVTGAFNSAFTIGNTMLKPVGASDALLIKLDGGGNVVWAKQGGVAGKNAKGSSITWDGQLNMYIGGYHEGMAAFDAVTVSDLGSTLAVKYDLSGNVAWAITDQGMGGETLSISARPNQLGIFAAGTYGPTTKFGKHALVSNGGLDSFATMICN